MNTYILYWLDGNKEKVRGTSIADAFRRAGYGGGALAALDFYDDRGEDTYTWNEEGHTWRRENAV